MVGYWVRGLQLLDCRLLPSAKPPNCASLLIPFPHLAELRSSLQIAILAAVTSMNRFISVLAVILFSGEALAPLLGAVEPISIFQPGSRILFQGDSITDGNRGRSEDPNHILGHGYVFIIAAQYGAAFPDLNLTFINRGISANKVTDLEKRWQQDTIDLKRDILSVLIAQKSK